MTKNTKNDFFSRIIKQDNGCHEFQSWSDRDGYRFFRFEGKDWKAHRLAVVFDGRDLPPGKVVMHHCDNPACVNPAHLSVATQKENSLDCVSKGRNPGNRLGTSKGQKHTAETITKIIATRTRNGTLNTNSSESIAKAALTKKLKPYKHSPESLAKILATKAKNKIAKQKQRQIEIHADTEA